MKQHVKKAFDLVAQATGLLRGTREEHVKIQEALHVIEEELTSKQEEKAQETPESK